jgi:hypothetical protein
MVIDSKEQAKILLDDWEKCRNARPRANAADVQISKDQLENKARRLGWMLTWDRTQLDENCKIFAQELEQYKKKVVLEILRHGAV